ncbi:DNA polymerase I [Anaerotalea alkaliphila]|uniref:DNA polymerase I n=1 Tax=Anaerotalea alkaliphila TaxID=2662126 RepID=A0A7X5HXX1_9FIRM|nr:DNA polymerase I [Anaerotalea alkaliphila]NDL68631.1 DNA polymerase I [Anaerotalea alkaliphila]
MDKLLLIDGNSIMNRAFYGLPLLTNAEGRYTNAVYGFLNILLKTMEEEAATHLVVSFDLKGPTFRHELFADYKGTRKGMPEELREQMPLVKEVLGAMDVSICEQEGLEADDLIGSLAESFYSQGMEVTILTGDRDLLQLAKDRVKVSIPKTKAGGTTLEHYRWEDVVEKIGVTPPEYVEVKGLMGDPSDNIPGIPGVGEKTAVKVIRQWHSIENAYAHLEELPKRFANLLQEHYEQAVLSKRLAAIVVDHDPGIALGDCKLDTLFTPEAHKWFSRLEFKSLMDRFPVQEGNRMQEGAFLSSRRLTVCESLDAMDLEGAGSPLHYHWIREPEEDYFLWCGDGDAVRLLAVRNPEREAFHAKLRGLLCNQAVEKRTVELKEQLHRLDLELDAGNKSVLDLGLAFYIIDPNRSGYSIAEMAQTFLQKAHGTEEGLLGKGKSRIAYGDLPAEDRAAHLANSLEVLMDISPLLLKKLEEVEGLTLYYDMELPLVSVLKSMETQGIQVDAEVLQAYSAHLAVMIGEVESEIHALAGGPFNINSPKQLGTVLFENLGLPTAKRTKTGYSTAIEVLEKLRPVHPIAGKIITYRQLAKLKSTYADGLFPYIREDGRIHSTFNQQIAATGRISSTEPNLQNIPIRMEIGREIRKAFIPAPGHVFVDADYSQIELRLLAHLSKDPNFILAFREGLDIHSMTASQVFHVPFEEVDKDLRRKAKAVNFGIVYGISDFGLSQDLDIGVYEAKKYIESYFNQYPHVKSFLDRAVEEAKENGFVTTMYGRRRPIPELASSNHIQRSFGERIAMNAPIQGSAADIIKIAMIHVHDRLKKEGFRARLLLQVHDELLVEAPVEEKEAVQALLVREMEHAAALEVPLTVDVQTAANWYDSK